VLVVIVVGVFYIKPANWSPFLPLGWGGVVRGAAYIFFAYIGFDAVSTAAEEVIDPQRALPIGILTSLGVCTVLYIAVAAVLTGMVPMHLIDLDAPLATAFVTRGLNFAAGIISVGAVAGLTSVLLVLLLGQSRVFYAISRDGLLPPAFSRVHPKYQTPSIPTVMTGVVVALTAALVPIKEIAELTNIGTLFAFVLVCMGVWIMRHVEPTMRRPFKTPLVPLVPIMGAASCILMMLGLDLTTWLRFFIWLGLGFVIYFSYGRFHSVVDAATNDHGRAAAMTQIIEAVDTILDERLGFVRAQVRSAFELNIQEQAELSGNLGQLVGSRVRMRFVVDPDLIGGVTARIGSRVYDGSVRGQLAAMRTRLSLNR